MTTEAQTIADIAVDGAEPKLIEANKLYLARDGEGVRVVDTRGYGDSPTRAKGSPVVRDATSFVAYLEKHGREESEVYADTETSKIVAVIDAHAGSHMLAGWREHLLTLALVHTKPWLKWLANDGKEMSQIEFANHLEENAADVHTPSAAVFLDIAQSFQANTKVDWKSAHRLATGEVKFGYEETAVARAGQNGDLEIPSEFKLALKPYVGGTIYGVGARFRYTIKNGDLRMTYLLDRPEAVLEAAFIDMVNEIRDGIPNVEEAPATSNTPAIPATPGRAGITQPIFFGKA